MVDDDMHFSVRTYVANDKRIVCHPSYQAYSYSRFLSNYSHVVSEQNIRLVPCAYLHNYQAAYKPALSAEINKEWYTTAPFFVMDETRQFNEFAKQYVTKRSSRGDLLYLIDHGRIRPTQSLQDSLATMVKGTPVFDLLDEQAVCYDVCIRTMLQCLKDQRKRTILVQGGPGTGKSVLAVNLLMRFITSACNAAYVTKNSAPRQAFLSILSGNKADIIAEIGQLFRSPFGLSQVPANSYDCLIVDEAHRLVKKMYGDWQGENQVKECIQASLFTVFLLDEDQAVTTRDIGSVQEIVRCFQELGSDIIMREETKLTSQFRCNGSDAYIQFIDRLLQRSSEPVDVSLAELNYDFQVFDDASRMRDANDDLARRLILNTYKTLLTRGQKGCYVYCEDDALREYLMRMCRAFSNNL